MCFTGTCPYETFHARTQDCSCHLPTGVKCPMENDYEEKYNSDNEEEDTDERE